MTDSKNFKGILISEFLARSTHSMTRSMLLKRMWAHYENANQVDALMKQFDDADMIRMEPGEGRDVVYTMTEETVEKFKKLFTRKSSI